MHTHVQSTCIHIYKVHVYACTKYMYMYIWNTCVHVHLCTCTPVYMYMHGIPLYTRAKRDLLCGQKRPTMRQIQICTCICRDMVSLCTCIRMYKVRPVCSYSRVPSARWHKRPSISVKRDLVSVSKETYAGIGLGISGYM
jgi:hypothetical protein